MTLGGKQRTARARAPWLALVLALGLATAVRAHEMGTLQMTATFHRDGTYRVDVAVDEERVSGFPVAGPPGETRYGRIAGFAAAVPAGERARLGPFLRTLVESSTLAFDGRPSPPEAVSLDRPPAPADDPFAPPPKLTLHLAGPIPPGARTATWRIDLVLGSFPIAFTNEGDAALSRQWLEGQRPSRPFRLSPEVVPASRWRVALRYLRLGYTRVLPRGTDHVLFLLGIFLLSLRWRPLLAQVTAFTLAQALALALSIYGLAVLPPRMVAPAVALSIVYVAFGNVLGREPGAWRIALVFACGLLHGLGLAGALRAPGLPRAELAAALLSCDLGAVAGQLTVLAAAFLLVGYPFRGKPWYRRRVAVPASLAIAAIGLYWSIQRIFF